MKKFFLIPILLKLIFVSPLFAATVTINPNKLTYVIPTNFIGLSIEKTNLCFNIKRINQSNSLLNLLKNISPAVLRIGGASVNSAKWQPDITSCSGLNITPNLVKDTFSTLEKINWKTIWGINLDNNTKENSYLEAKSVYSYGSNSILAVELGNEPEFTYSSFSDYNKKWSTFVEYIQSQNKDIKFAGSSSTRDSFLSSFIEKNFSNISFVTLHLYPGGSNDLSDPQNVSKKLDRILDSSVLLENANKFKTLSTQAKNKGLNVYLEETNSVGQGGTPNVSDTFASSLWAIDYIFTALENGIKGVYFHGGPSNTQPFYSPISSTSNDSSGQIYAKPLYYALLFYKQVSPNGQIVPTEINTSFNISAHSISSNDGKLQIILINKEMTSPISITVNTTKNYSQGRTILLTSPSLTTTISSPNDSQIKLADSSINSDGTWTPQKIQTFNIGTSSFMVNLKPYSAALITLSNDIIPSLKPSPTIQPTITSSPSPTAAIACIPYNNSTKTSLNNYSVWRSELILGNFGSVSKNNWQSDFDCDQKITLNDFSLWRNAFLRNINDL